MEIVYTKDEFKKYERMRSIVLSADYADYDYYAVYIPETNKVELYFENPFDEKYYNIKDIKAVLGKKINPNHDIYMYLVQSEFKECKSFLERIGHNDR